MNFSIPLDGLLLIVLDFIACMCEQNTFLIKFIDRNVTVKRGTCSIVLSGAEPVLEFQRLTLILRFPMQPCYFMYMDRSAMTCGGRR